MKNHRFLLTILFFVFSISLNAQNRIDGIVVDEKTKERLAFVNIVVNEDGTLGTTTDIDGSFSISTNKEINTLTFSSVGYENKTIEINDKDKITIRLKPTTYRLSDIIIDGGNNPAHRVIDSVFKYRDSNNPKSLDSYYYKIYDNMVFTMDTNLLIYQDIRNELKDKDILAMETVSEQFYRKPNKNKKNILANKFSGSKSSMFVYVIESLQSVGFYDDFININEKKYVNPISRGSKNKYIFVLESALKNESNDSIFTISFRPYRNTNFNAMSGTMTINSDNWAIQNIKAKPSKKDNMLDIEIQQLYEKVDEKHWFPKQLNTIIATFDRDNANIDTIMTSDTTAYIAMHIDGNISSNVPLLGIGKSYITDVEINKDIDKKIFGNADFTINENAANADELIIHYRYDTLSSERLEATYNFIDSILQEENINLDKISNIITTIMSGEIPIGIFDFNINDLTDYNIGNGWKLGLGLKTNEKMSDFISVGAFGNYWFKAKEFNYGGDIDFNILPSKGMKLRFHATHEFERLGDYGFKENNRLTEPSNYKHYYVKATALNDIISAEYSTYLNKYLKGFVRFEVGDKTVFDGQPSTDNEQQTYRLSSLDMRLRIAFKEKFVLSGKTLSVEGNANPVIWLSYQKNLKGVFGSPYDFDKIEFKFKGKKEFKYLGETSLVAQAGYIKGFAPVTELFNIEGSYEHKFDVYCSESFSTMRPDEFFCDRFAALYFSHNFKNLLMDFKRFHPEIIVVTNIAFGDLGYQGNREQGIREQGTGYQGNRESGNRGTGKLSILGDSETQRLGDLRKGYYESGLIIDNILNAGFTKLGFGMFYRYGPYSYDKTWDNFAFKISVGYGL